MKKRTLQYKTKNLDGSTVGHAMRFPLPDMYKAIYRAMRRNGECFEVKVFTWYEKEGSKR